MDSIIKAIICMVITKEVTMVTTEVDEVALTSQIITLITIVEISAAEVVVAVVGMTAAATCKVTITSIKEEAVEAWATNSLGAEVDISMEEVSTDLRVLMVDTMGKIMEVTETLCSPTCLNIKKEASTVIRTSILNTKALICHRTPDRWAWVGHQEVAPILQLLVAASLGSSSKT